MPMDMTARPNAYGDPAQRVTAAAKESNARETALRSPNAGLDVSGTLPIGSVGVALSSNVFRISLTLSFCVIT